MYFDKSSSLDKKNPQSTERIVSSNRPTFLHSRTLTILNKSTTFSADHNTFTSLPYVQHRNKDPHSTLFKPQSYGLNSNRISIPCSDLQTLTRSSYFLPPLLRPLGGPLPLPPPETLRPWGGPCCWPLPPARRPVFLASFLRTHASFFSPTGETLDLTDLPVAAEVDVLATDD